MEDNEKNIEAKILETNQEENKNQKVDCQENKEEIGVLVAHSVVPALFNKTEEPIPSCLSKTVVSNVLKNQLGYKGLIFSDDLLMAALQNNGYESVESISMAIKAGINVLMIAQKEYIPFINEIVKLCQSDIELVNQIEISAKKIIDFKIQHGLLNYSEGKVVLPNVLTEEELIEYQNMKYDEFKKRNDIAKYGLYSYEEFSEYVTYEQFIAFRSMQYPLKYLILE